MSTRYRNKSNNLSPNAPGIVTNHLKTKTYGAKLKNSFTIDETLLHVGLGTGKRNWDGKYNASNKASPINGRKSINDTNTINRAIFATAKHQFNQLILPK